MAVLPHSSHHPPHAEKLGRLATIRVGLLESHKYLLEGVVTLWGLIPCIRISHVASVNKHQSCMLVGRYHASNAQPVHP